MTLLDLPSKKRRQIYLVTFPAGALFILAFALIQQEKLPPVSLAAAALASILLLACSILLFLQPESLASIESVFYLFMVLFFPVFAGSNLNSPATIARSTPEFFGETTNGMTIWEVIFFVGAFLSLSQRLFKFVVGLACGLIFAIGLVNTILLQNAGRLEPAYIFHWGHSLFAMAVTAFLIVRIGHLQQRYATTDLLTGILNRRAASNLLASEYERAVRYQTPFAVILLDIDYFKRVNDTFGHPIGDLVLKEFAEVLAAAIRKTDHVARWGGEEFLIILPQTSLDGAKIIAERIRAMIEAHVYTKSQKLTSSFGVAVYSPGKTMADLLSAVDEALYQAKRQGRNTVSICDDVQAIHHKS
jgi:diguanylate cyclase (GGDEF)-like protein